MEVTCDHVIIINRGTVAASGSLAELAQRAGERAMVTAVVNASVDEATVRRLLDVDRVEAESSGVGTRLRIQAADSEQMAARLYAVAMEQGWQVRELRLHQQTLEDLFVRIVGRQEELENTPAVV